MHEWSWRISVTWLEVPAKFSALVFDSNAFVGTASNSWTGPFTFEQRINTFSSLLTDHICIDTPAPSVLQSIAPNQTNSTLMEQVLFSPKLIPESIASTLPLGYKIRPLQSGDYERGVLDVLAVLTTIGEISKEKYIGIFLNWFVLIQNALGGYKSETIHISLLSLRMMRIKLSEWDHFLLKLNCIFAWGKNWQ